MSDATAGVSSRYRVGAALGKGGMGAVYRALDQRTGRAVALKRLKLSGEPHADRLTALFSREYHTLAQLRHPSVIEVFDYGVDEQGPYYTMELLEGDDLYDEAPLPHARACALLHDIASSLALLHARRLVHRDVSSRNIRVLPNDRAKLLDFGALLPMGTSEEIVGTAMFVPPEALLSQALDGRSDLYALGVALYHALTGRFPYPARKLDQLNAAWERAPAPPSKLVGNLPPELDRLVMSLLALDRTARPRDAPEVMERLSAIAGLHRDESAAASGAYLATPRLVGRTEQLRVVRDALIGAMRGRGVGLSIVGPPGVGRSRMLDAAVLEARLLGATVLRTATRRTADGPFASLQALLSQLHESMPELAGKLREGRDAAAVLFEATDDGQRPVDLASLQIPRAQVIGALRDVFRHASSVACPVIAVDDADRLDGPSAAMLATLLQAAFDQRLALLITWSSESGGAISQGHSRLRGLTRALQLEALPADEMHELMRSLFGDAPNLQAVAERVHRLSLGRPRDAMALAEHLIARDVIRYRDGAFSLPEDLSVAELPSSMADALRQRALSLPEATRQLAIRHALSAYAAKTLGDYAAYCPQLSEAQLHEALDALVAAEVLVTNGHTYHFNHEGWLPAFSGDLSASDKAAHHRVLAQSFGRGRDDLLALAYHRLLGGDEESALSLLHGFGLDYTDQAVDVFDKTALRPVEISALLGAAYQAVERVRDNVRLHATLEYLVMAMGVFVDESWFSRLAPSVLEQLKRESGWDHWQSLPAQGDPVTRSLAAVQAAQAAYDADPNSFSRTPITSIQLLVQFTAAAMAFGVRTADVPLLRALPGLLEPFAPLTPIVDAILHNALATCEIAHGRFEEACQRYKEVLVRLSGVDVQKLDHADEIRSAVTFAVAVSEERLGLQTAASWCDKVIDHPRHRANALNVRSLLCLQRGDWEGGRELKRRAAQAQLESDHQLLFGSTTAGYELELYTLGLDLGAVKRMREELEALAARYPGWRRLATAARGAYHRLRGDLPRALADFEQALESGGPRRRGLPPEISWYLAAGGKLEVLVALGRAAQVRREAEAILSTAEPPIEGVRFDGIQRALALAEAELGDCQGAQARLAARIDYRKALGTSGIFLGVLYEAAAQVALHASDSNAFNHFAQLTAGEFLQCPDSGLAARYERLLQSARRASIAVVEAPPTAHSMAVTATLRAAQPESLVVDALRECATHAERAQRGLWLLCERGRAPAGHLFLLRKEGLELAASVGEPAPVGTLREFLLSRVHSELQSLDQPTVCVAEPSPSTRTTWVGPGGDHYHALLLEARVGARSVLVGVCALRYPASTLRPPATAHDLGVVLGGYYLDIGDAVADEVPFSASGAARSGSGRQNFHGGS